MGNVTSRPVRASIAERRFSKSLPRSPASRSKFPRASKRQLKRHPIRSLPRLKGPPPISDFGDWPAASSKVCQKSRSAGAAFVVISQLSSGWAEKLVSCCPPICGLPGALRGNVRYHTKRKALPSGAVGKGFVAALTQHSRRRTHNGAAYLRDRYRLSRSTRPCPCGTISAGTLLWFDRVAFELWNASETASQTALERCESRGSALG